MNKSHEVNLKNSLSGKFLFFGPPFKAQLIYLFISSLLFAAWASVNGYLNVMLFQKRQTAFRALAGTAGNQQTALADWVNAENSLDSWVQGRTLAAVIWLITIVSMTYSVVKITSDWTGGTRKWSSKWAIGGWFIPVANLFIPFLVMRESERIIKRSLGDTKIQELAVSKSFDTVKSWFIGNIFVLGLFGASAELMASEDWDQGTYGVWCAVLASALLVVVVTLAFVYFARQSHLISHAMLLRQSTSNEEGSGQTMDVKSPSPSVSVTADAGYVAEQIRHLGKLQDEGLITSLEFERKKNELLDRI